MDLSSFGRLCLFDFQLHGTKTFLDTDYDCGPNAWSCLLCVCALGVRPLANLLEMYGPIKKI